jgi:hypothetical protein
VGDRDFIVLARVRSHRDRDMDRGRDGFANNNAVASTTGDTTGGTTSGAVSPDVINALKQVISFRNMI